MADHIPDIPDRMRAITVSPDHTFQNPANAATDLYFNPAFPVPVPSATQYLIRVRSVGISRYELTWEGTYTAPIKPRIPCFDVAGTVVTSPSNGKWRNGDNVFGLLPWDGQGGLADFVIAEEKYLAAIPEWGQSVPEHMKFVTAAVLPRAALTAYQAFRVLKGGLLKEGMNVLVTGAAGAVGKIGVQIARDGVGEKGRVVSVTRSGAGILIGDVVSSMDEVSKLGLRFDLVFDTIGGEFLEKSIELAKDGGSVVTVASPVPVISRIRGIDEAHKRGVNVQFFIVEESGEQLEKVAELVQRGVIKPAIGVMVDGLDELKVRDAWGSTTHPTANSIRDGGIVINPNQ